MNKKFSNGDLVVTNNFTLKQDIYRVQNGELKNIGRYTRYELFRVLNNFIKSEKLYDKEVKIYIPYNMQVSEDFDYNHMIEHY